MAPSSRSVVPFPSQSPSQQGWVWNGTNWVCDPCCDGSFPTPPPCPPSGFPTPCPPWFPPPAGQAPWYPGANGGVSFSATPPANPIRGNFWWDGLMLHLFDGAAWVDIGPSVPGSPGGGGTVVGTSPPMNPAIGTTWWNGTIFQVWDGNTWKLVGPPSSVVTTVLEFAIMQPANVTVGVDNAHWTALPLTATPSVDVQNGWSPGTLRYTPTKAGYYQFQGRGRNTSTAGIAIVKNDPGTYTALSSDITVAISSSSASGWLSVSGIAPMNGTTDYVRLWGYENTATFLAAGSNNVLSAYLLP